MSDVYQFMEPCLPSDHYRQTNSEQLTRQLYKDQEAPKNVLDFGCGVGATIDFFATCFPEIKWVGVDIESSPEVNARTRDDGEFHTFDGVNLPFGDSEFDLVYSHQVLEHVRYPEKALREIRRVLKPKGRFVGQTSQLEPYHSFSIFNFTPYGFKLICEDAGLKVEVMRPGIDGITLIERQVRGRPKHYSQWFKTESPINLEIERFAKKDQVSAKVMNFRKLLSCGQFSFMCTKA